MARAGLSRADAEAMRKGASGGGSPSTNPKTTPDQNPDQNPNPGDTPYDEKPKGFQSDELKASIREFMANLKNTSSKTPVIGNDNGYANRYWDTAPVTGKTSVSPVSSDEIYYEVDIDEQNKKKNKNNRWSSSGISEAFE